MDLFCFLETAGKKGRLWIREPRRGALHQHLLLRDLYKSNSVFFSKTSQNAWNVQEAKTSDLFQATPAGGCTTATAESWISLSPSSFPPTTLYYRVTWNTQDYAKYNFVVKCCYELDFNSVDVEQVSAQSVHTWCDIRTQKPAENCITRWTGSLSPSP